MCVTCCSSEMKSLWKLFTWEILFLFITAFKIFLLSFLLALLLDKKTHGIEIIMVELKNKKN